MEQEPRPRSDGSIIQHLDKGDVSLQRLEELLRIFVKDVPAGVAMLDRQLRYLLVSDRWCADYHLRPSQTLGRLHYDVFPDIPLRWKEMHTRALRGEIVRINEDRWDRGDGSIVWLRWELLPWRTRDGEVGGILILSEDITYRKQTEEALAAVSGKLVQAQEDERRRIARELHDDVNQRLALLIVKIGLLQEDKPDNARELDQHLRTIQSDLQQLSMNVEFLAHKLHPPQLEYLGLASAIESFCQEFSASHRGAKIDFVHRQVPKDLPNDISLCLFRIVQEGLHNAAKHSGATYFKVTLACEADEVQLSVSDSGKGFNASDAIESGGLGLLSMRERVRLLNGTLIIESDPVGGTSLNVRLPLNQRK